jgi:hypothetical protein
MPFTRKPSPRTRPAIPCNGHDKGRNADAKSWNADGMSWNAASKAWKGEDKSWDVDEMTWKAEPFECGENHRFCILRRDTALVRKVRGTPAKRPAGEQKRRMIARTQKRPDGTRSHLPK